MKMNSSLDIPIQLEDVDEIHFVVDTLVEEAVKQGSIEPAVTYLVGLRKSLELSGKALARFLYKLGVNWELFKESESEKFTNYIYSIIGFAPHTTERYVKVAYLLDTAPDKVKDKLENMSIGHLIPVANAVYQEYQITDENWDDITKAANDAGVREIVRDIKGEEPRKHGLRLWIDDNGSLWAFRGQDERYFFGSLEIKDESSVVQKAIKRVISKANIMEEK